jgi:hypothetical protein
VCQRVWPGVRRVGLPRQSPALTLGQRRRRRRLDSILKGVAGQVGGLLWDATESDGAAADDDDGEGTPGVLAPL